MSLRDPGRAAAMVELAALVGLRAVRCSWAGRGEWRMETDAGDIVAGDASLHDCERWLSGYCAGVRSMGEATRPSDAGVCDGQP